MTLQVFLDQFRLDACAPIAVPLAPKPPFGLLAFAMDGIERPLEILQSAAGFYLGTFGDCGPCSRESVQYWRSSAAAQEALDTGYWTQRAQA